MTKVAIADIETNGLLHRTKTSQALDRVHVLCMLIPGAVGTEPERLSFWRHDGYSGPAPAAWVARHFPHLVNEGEEWDATTEWNIELPPQDTIAQGLAILHEADVISGHNWQNFDHKAIQKVYPKYAPKAKIEDTLVMARLARPDTKASDSALAARGKMPGYLVGSHSLDAWGHRLGKHKGDYMKEMIKKGIEPWSKWSPFMAAYCENDVEVSYVLWAALKGEKLTEMSQDLEHGVHELLDYMENSGIFFHRPAAEQLEQTLRTTKDTLVEQVKAKYGRWIAPEKKRVVKPQWEHAKPIEGKKFHAVRPEYGEDMSRAVWGEVSVWKRTSTTHVTIGEERFKVHQEAGAPRCKLVWKDFNPGSRNHIIDRFTTVHDWRPVDFTEKGNPELSDTVLQQIKHRIPEAAPMAEIFLHSKLLGQLADGKKSWLNKLNEETGRLHPYVNSNGAVSGRCTHSDPNIGQVPAVMVEDVKLKDGTVNPKVCGLDGAPLPYAFDADGNMRKKAVLRGRAGEYGFECRSLFYTPEMIDGVEWQQIGVDLSGIEMRMLGEVCAEFDGGAMLEHILHGDIHQRNMEACGITSRDVMKRGTYACVPMDTLALTRRGWVGYEDLVVGEDVMTYNSKEGVKEWSPVLEKVFYEDAPLIEMSTGQGFCVTSTPNHRWFCDQRRMKGADRYYTPCVTTTEELNSEHRLITNAPFVGDLDSRLADGLLRTPKYEGTDWVRIVLSMSQRERDTFLVGFCIADGCWHKGRTPSSDTWSWCQNIGTLSEAALLASYLCADRKLYVTERSDSLSPMIRCKIGTKGFVTGQRLVKRSVPNAPVWCVRTANSSWVIRQGNTITITGNTMYGAGDEKLGITVAPDAHPSQYRQLGAAFRATMMQGLPALKKAIEKCQKDVKQHGYLIGLDGRKLYSRSAHSALNLRLQSNGALIAKKWLLLTEQYALDSGMNHGWGQDFVMMLFVHDEIASAARRELSRKFADCCIQAASDAGKFFNISSPIGAEAKFGRNWSETH